MTMVIVAELVENEALIEIEATAFLGHDKDKYPTSGVSTWTNV